MTERALAALLRRIVREELAAALHSRGPSATATGTPGHIPPPVRRGGYVYFVASGLVPHAIKIGITGDIAKRLKTIRTGNPYPVSLLGAYWVDEPEREEAGLHSWLRRHRIRGEWYRPVDEIIELIAWAASKEFLGPPLEAVIVCLGERGSR